MKAIVYDKKNSRSPLQLREIEKPQPLDDEVLIKVVCVSLNAADSRSLKLGIIPKKRIFGSAIAGIVESVGKNIQQLKPGDAVLGDLSDFSFGGLAEYVAVPEKALVLKPQNTSFEEAVTLPVAATTALKAMRDLGKIQEGQSVLIVGSAGGVGSFALQLAHYFGAKVTAVCSSKNREQSLALKADVVLDYTEHDFTKGNHRYDLVLAINGNYSLLGYRRVLKPNGICVTVGGSLSQILKSVFFGWMLSVGGKRMKTLSAKADPKDLEYVARLLAEGKIKALIFKHYTLAESAEAMEMLSKGHTPAKVVIHI